VGSGLTFMEQRSIGIAEKMDERGALRIRSLIGKYGLKSLLEAVRVEIHETPSSHTYGDKIRDDPEDADLQEAKRVSDRTNGLRLMWRQRRTIPGTWRVL
jgi:hypothetical protein